MKSNTNTNAKTHMITMLAMLSAIAYIVMLLSRMLPPIFPAVPFLKYDPKDIIIVMGGLMFGPLASVIISTLVSFIEMFTISETGIIGAIMNILSSCAFACPAAYLYKKKHTMSGAVVGLAIGTILMTTIMLLWNYLITPLYLGVPREDVIPLLTSAILPFNLIKCSINMAITLLIYKPIVTALRKVNLLTEDIHAEPAGRRSKIGVTIIAIVMLITCILIFLSQNEII